MGQSRLARTGQPGQPYDHASMTVSFSSNPMINRAFRPKDVCALNGLPMDVSSSEDNSAAGHILMIDDYKATRCCDLFVVIHYERLSPLDRYFRHLIFNHRKS